MSSLRLGKAPATADSRDLMFAKYVEPAKLPTPPAQFGHETLFGARAWGMLGNDEWGDCAWAGPAHETMLLTKEGGHQAHFTTADVLSDYAAGTGFNPKAGPPGDNPTDEGSDVRKVLGYRRSTGIVDSKGTRHKIGAYVRLDEKDLSQVYLAMYLFQVIGIGIKFPDTAMDQFHKGEPWDVVAGAHVEGGHYISGVAKRANIDIVTWGAVQQMTERFFETYCDEAWVYVSTENLKNGVSPEGFNITQLQTDIASL
jgi:hypothetical protein